MERRSNAMSGYVKFPVDDPIWKNTNEGGMVVKLAVCDNRDIENQFGVCSGAFVADVMNESFIGDDKYSLPECCELDRKAQMDMEVYHFPLFNDPDSKGLERYLSRPYLAILIMASTGWSGWHKVKDRYWQCQFDDLTDEGKALYRQIESLYQGCDLHLLTFLDT